MSRGAILVDDEIFKLDTIPPPDGEADPYNAPTKVGPLARAEMEKRASDYISPVPSSREVVPVPGRPRAVLRTLPAPYAELDEGDELDPTDLFGGGGPCVQSGKTQLLEIAIATPAIGPARRPVSIEIPARVPEPISERNPGVPQDTRRGISVREVLITIVCVTAIVIPCAWFLLLR